MEELFKFFETYTKNSELINQQKPKNEIFNQSSVKTTEPSKTKKTFKPPYNMYRDEATSYIEIVVPGFKKEQLNILIDNKVLKVTGARDVISNKIMVVNDFNLGEKFEVEFNINDDVIVTDSVEAKYNEGILLISFKKKTNKTFKNNIKINYV